MAIVPLSWLGMMIVHECGHVLMARVTGGTVTKVVLHPLEFSRTDVFPNPHPLAVAWGGPIFGALAPLLVFVGTAALHWGGAYLLRFFAGFCLVANGAYVGAGAFERVGDAATMLVFGSARWQLALFGILTFLAGLSLWHRLGRQFGISPRPKPVSACAAYGTLLVLLLVIAAELLLDSR